jgi:hypothetical protein
VGRLQPNKQPPPALAAMRLPVNLPRLMGLRLVREKHMDNSQGDIDPDIFEYLSKLPPDILEEMANEGLRAQEDQKYREVLLPLSWECLKSYFISKDDFNSFIESFANPKDKKKFIYLSSFWKVMGDDYHGAYPQSIQLIVIFSIIEKLYENERFIDFYTCDEISGIIINLRNAFIHSACTVDVFLPNGETTFHFYI